MKNLLKLKGTQALSKNEQQAIQGGKDTRWCERHPNGTICGGSSDYRCYMGQCLHCSQSPYDCN